MSESKVEVSVAYGQKVGMTRIFNDEGKHLPVTVVKIFPSYVSQVKTLEKDQVNSYQLAFREKKKKLVTKPVEGVLKKAKIEANCVDFAEFKVDTPDPDALGKKVTFTHLKEGEKVDVSGVSKGKGFQGVMKKFGFRGGPATHGSHFHRRPGSIGNRATPGKVFKLKKMPGQLGNKACTTQNLKVVQYNEDQSYALISGAIPGGKNSIVKIARSIKQ